MSRIEIRIKAGSTSKNSSVTATGKLVHMFGNNNYSESDAELDRAVLRHYGKEDQFQSKIPWLQAWSCFEPKKAEIVEFRSEPTILASEIFRNDSNQKTTFTKKMTKQVSNSVSNTWSSSSSDSVGQKLNYKIELHGIGGGGETTFGYTRNWGTSETVTKQTTLGMETGVTVDVKPRESVIFELSARSVEMRVRITYESYLKGKTTVNYDPTKYEHSIFLGLPLKMILDGSYKQQFTEDIEMSYYSSATTKVKDTK